MAKISIIVPCYNAEKSVERTLESLLNQTCKDICILAIDDGSKDTTGKILDDYQAKYPEIIKVFHKPNEGIAATRNFGLDHVETPYFGFLDSDDYCEPEMFEKLLAKAESSGAEVVISNFTWETS
ncbi:MAG: glycosyltransferase family 2 protein, partial [Erysipelotrichaceae bacterium]|nr:glycosyltransferase family 2 protein [Erysipelotrichaceae bacterium]